MSFVSYAQNFEDVMLWRALSHVGKGFYIDIGAQDPVSDSVSLAFYEHDWRGVHVEPTEQYSTKLKLARPDEVIEQVAIGSGAQTLEFYEFSDTGLSTSDDSIAKLHIESGYKAIRRVVPVMPLDALLEKYRDRDVNWMKIDVEGLEKNVIESWVESAIRPWILVIESTLPLSQEQSHGDWEHLILAKGYRFAYFDGLNRFYVHESHPELFESFNRPPNVFDRFVLGGKASHSFYQLIQNHVSQAEAETRRQELLRASLEDQLAALYASTSWRLTRPLRWLVFQSRLAKELGFTVRLKTFVKKILKFSLCKTSLFFVARPQLRARCISVLRSARLYDVARKLFNRLAKSAAAKRAIAPLSEQHLTGRGRDLYLRLKKAAEQRGGRQ
ncbi:FkbM family methyltransferase [Pseudomonas sp. MWU12-2037]|uniref:FkbM family methyltransferase n=1 Tax=Pseudomonas sp. MWU12-2037 TaxID=2928690 RepID=UPI002010C532|nr:FkbM family methyltransferase [Pseudomonas sp. MWU12-2037]